MTSTVAGPTLRDRPALVRALAAVKAAAAEANAAGLVLGPPVASAIVAACDRLAGDGAALDVPLLAGGGGVLVNRAMNTAIASLASTTGTVTVAPADVNRSQSTADVLHTENVDARDNILAAIVGQLAKPEAQAPALRLFSKKVRYETLAWAGAIGTALTMMSAILALLIPPVAPLWMVRSATRP